MAYPLFALCAPGVSPIKLPPIGRNGMKPVFGRASLLSGVSDVYPAGRFVLWANGDLWRISLAFFDGERTTRLKWAAFWRMEHIGRRARNRLQVHWRPRRRDVEPSRADPVYRDGADWRRVLRSVARSAMCPAYMTRMRSAMPATTPRSWVMRMTAVFRSRRSRADKLQYLRLYRHVERGGWLVGDQQLGVGGDGDGDHDALAHATAELVRIAANAALGVRDTHRVEQLACAIVGGLRLSAPNGGGAAQRLLARW